MSTLFFIILFLSFVWFILALIKPLKFAPFFKKRPRLKSLASFIVIFFVSIVVIAINSPAPVATNKPNKPNVVKTESKEIKKQNINKDDSNQQKEITHDVTAEKKEIMQTMATVPGAHEISVSEMNTGVYELFFNLNVNYSDETKVRSLIVPLLQGIAQDNAGKSYKLQSIRIVALNNGAPVALYSLIGSEFSASGKDEYSVLNKGKTEKFNP